MKKIDKQFEEYLNYCEKVRLMSSETMRIKRWIINNFTESCNLMRIEDITNQDIIDWVEEQVARGCAGRTINNRISHIEAAVRYFLDMGVQIPNLKLRLLVKAKEMPPKRIYYSKQQINLVLRYADRLEWLLISLCYDCGFRISELRNLRLLNIDGQRVTYIGKGSKSRESYMSEETRAHLDDWIGREKVTDYLWVRDGRKGKRVLTVDEIRYLMRKPFWKAGYTDFYPHALRHSFATNICDNGAPLAIAQKMLGHSNLSTTERYVHTFDGHLKEYFTKYKFQVA